MRMNVAYNGVGEGPLVSENQTQPAEGPEPGDTAPEPSIATELDPEEGAVNGAHQAAGEEALPDHIEYGRRPGCTGKVRVNEGDAWSVHPPTVHATPVIVPKRRGWLTQPIAP